MVTILSLKEDAMYSECFKAIMFYKSSLNLI